ncbi:WD repeat-containing protein 74 [Achroia grisella]|uniref:WD repeat-containing protein 74 n=1 Tax=Achroia grisella TaxID=688607 RepID=UPI0027D283CC|nr:WD repeat-containing protein 74 [Achroia grisella]
MLLTEDKEVDIFVGSKIGSFKHIKYHTDISKNNKKCIENLVDIKSLQKDDSLTCMVWGNEEQTEILLGRRNQQIQVYNTQQDEFTKSYTADFGAGHPVGLGRYKRKYIAALSSGMVKIWSKKSETTMDAGKMDRMRVCGDEPALFATGGEENDLKIWQIGEKAPVFAAKNLAHDWLQLRRPVWVSDLTFLPNEGGKLVAVCSRHGYVRLYDSRAQRRPVCNVDFNAMAAVCIAPSFDERNVLVGFGRGQLHQVDLRKGRPDKGFKGAVGAITDVLTVPGERLIISSSLDRHIRIHSYESKELVYKQYLTSKLSAVLVQTATSTPLKKEPEVKEELKEEKEEVELIDDDLDELFDNMETVGEKPKKKKIQSEQTEAKKQKLEPEDAIKQLLKSTEKQKRKREQRKREKKAKSVFHNA